MHVLIQLYNFCGKGSLHSLFTGAPIFSRGNRGRASVSQFPPAPMSSDDRKRYFCQLTHFCGKGSLHSLFTVAAIFFARKSRKSIVLDAPRKFSRFLFLSRGVLAKVAESQPAVPSPVPRASKMPQRGKTNVRIDAVRAWHAARIFLEALSKFCRFLTFFR